MPKPTTTMDAPVGAPTNIASFAVAVVSAFGPHAVGAILTGPDADAVLASEHALQVVRLTLPREV